MSSQQTNNSNPVLVPSNLGDGTCDPPCVNGGVCSFCKYSFMIPELIVRSSLLLFKLYHRNTMSNEYHKPSNLFADFICDLEIDDAARFNAAAYIAICLSTFLLGILSAFCCRIVHDQHQDTYEQDEVPLMKKYRDVNKLIGRFLLLISSVGY